MASSTSAVLGRSREDCSLHGTETVPFWDDRTDRATDRGPTGGSPVPGLQANELGWSSGKLVPDSARPHRFTDSFAPKSAKSLILDCRHWHEKNIIGKQNSSTRQNTNE